ncbi:MAG: hypothetical protein E6G06_17640 [Actinobacteria bacterium]|nr:MAG: hypothetical protein E6G06_17640 [Actinomycetota bacterium]
MTLVVAGLGAPTAFALERAPDRDQTHRGPCDPIDPTACLLPFPNDFFTVPDPSTDTGLRVHLAPTAMPRNAQGTPIDVSEWNHNDGFSPGAEIVTHVPGLDLVRTGAAPITDIARSLRRDAPIVLLDARTGRRAPYWAELDAHATADARRALIIRPARNLEDGRRYIVALRDLRDRVGAVVHPAPAFAAFLRGDGDRDRQHHMDRLFATLARRGIARRELYLAWDFTVASTRNLSERMLHIRDDAFDSLGGAAPRYTVTQVQEPPAATSPRVARRIQGTFEVPSYLSRPGGPAGSRFNYRDPRHDLPSRLAGNTQVANFVCIVPRSATPDHPAQPSLYGHGLFNDATEVRAENVKDMANEHDFVFCGTDWLGLTGAGPDLGEGATVFTDFSHLPELADRLQQAMLDALFLGRLMIHPRGFGSDPAFRSGGAPLLDPAAGLVYDGNSLGGIMGGALTAVAQDFTRAVLGVAGMNFSTLLDRSIGFPRGLFEGAYPDPLDQQLVFALMQMVWDRADASGYANHLADHPLPRTPTHRVLVHVAFGDHQVANVASDVEARTIGAVLRAPALADGRSPDVTPAWGIPTIAHYPFAGSALVVWDSGSPPPPTTNTPPGAGVDPHEDPRAAPVARVQKAVFLTTGEVIDVCGPGPCRIPHA